MSGRVVSQVRTDPNRAAIRNTVHRLNPALESENLDFSSSAKKTIYSSLAGVSGFFIGYEASGVHGVIRSRAFIDIVESPTTLVLTDDTLSSILTLLYCGAFIGSIAAGYSAEHIGRRLTIIAASCLYSFGAVIQLLVGVGQCNGLAAIISGRFIAGLGIGAISTGTILYMAEAVSYA